ncbi:hypothetical protein CKO38_17755 [Rhodospirillum rubrum]|uniref:ferritin-like domain-containing protein n=1 Tax=Rhodospirillum rubrum TaxID=1085 RepID=UPI001904ACF8|nr:ferritin-like domain-containing protein [Rhodospirillum rubrum]MBK1665644.1 hypothetical protein [Rhodospirillum rubrum]MBK1678472.1 hypothetical protein [Rhodospirillum rubrum]
MAIDMQETASAPLFRQPVSQGAERRIFLRAAVRGTLSVGALGVLAACAAKGGPRPAALAAAVSPATSQDIETLNVALGLEHEAIAAYQLGADSGLLTRTIVPTMLLFQDHHKQHRDTLISAITTLGGKSTPARSLGDYATALGAGALRTQGDVLTLAAGLELGAINAYLGVIPTFHDRDLSQVAGRLAADETLHWTILNHALGGAPPVKALSFGA